MLNFRLQLPESIGWLFAAKRAVGLRTSSILLLLFLKLLSVLTEIIGFSIFGPLLEFLENNKSIPNDSSFQIFWDYLNSLFSLLGLSITFGALIVALLIVVFSRQIVGFAHTYFGAVVKARIQKTILDKIINLAVNAQIDYLETYSRGAILNDATKEADRCILGLFKAITLIANITLLFSYFLLLYVVIGAGIFLVFPACIILIFVFRPLMKKSKTLSYDVTVSSRNSFDAILQILESVRFIKLSGLEQIQKEKMGAITQKIYVGTKHLAKINSLLAFGIEPLIFTTVATFVYFGVEHEIVAISGLAVLFLMVLRLVPVVKEIIPGIQSIAGVQASSLAVKRIIAQLENFNEFSKVGKTIDLKHKVIRFEKISFRYQNSSNDIISDFSYQFSPGKLYCIVGPSGVGKSTLLDLLPLLRLPTSGRVAAGAIDLTHCSKRSIRENISVAFCNPKFLPLSILDFLKSENRDVSMEKIELVTKQLGIFDWVVKLPNGFGEIIKDQANDFSSGQKQRLELARVLLSNKHVIIFDEPTTNLDTKNITKFIQCLTFGKFQEERIVIMVTHDPRIVKLADEVIEL
jgi:ABC-type bacteriocin/lantibiotic exporter with double-glycine peptidase domain